MEIEVCAGCGDAFQAKDKDGNPVCLSCIGIFPDSGKAVKIVEPDEYRCTYCKRVSQTVNLRKVWKVIPFANPADGTFYCGCRGWD